MNEKVLLKRKWKKKLILKKKMDINSIKFSYPVSKGKKCEECPRVALFTLDSFQAFVVTLVVENEAFLIIHFASDGK